MQYEITLFQFKSDSLKSMRNLTLPDIHLGSWPMIKHRKVTQPNPASGITTVQTWGEKVKAAATHCTILHNHYFWLVLIHLPINWNAYAFHCYILLYRKLHFSQYTCFCPLHKRLNMGGWAKLWLCLHHQSWIKYTNNPQNLQVLHMGPMLLDL